MKPRPGREVGAHQEVQMVLPWYANGTLVDQERQAVEEHLAICPACQTDLAECYALATAMQTAENVSWSPSPTHVERLMARLEAVESRRTRLRDAWQALGAWGHTCRELLQTTPLAMRWALASQGALVLFLASLLVWQAPWTPQTLYRTLSDSPAPSTSGLPDGAIRVVFADDMTAHDLQLLLTRIGGSIVQGPSPLGVYTVGFARQDHVSELVQAGVTILRAHPKVRLAEPLLKP